MGEGTSQVVELCDHTAHAEVTALRAASTALGRHLITGGIMYCSSESCPMCLVACYWAQISRVIYAATSYDVATYGFEDLQLHRELTKPNEERLIRGAGSRPRPARRRSPWATGLDREAPVPGRGL